MKKKIKLMFIIEIIILLLVAISCRFPYKIVPNLPTTPPLPETSTPILSVTKQLTTESTQETPTPEPTSEPVNISPSAGSVLTWMDYSNFVYIPADEFKIGKDSVATLDYSPAHRVSLDGFWIQQNEVTNQQYAQCVSDGKCSVPLQEADIPYWYEDAYYANHPVVGVTWFQAREYCSYIQSRLPTEAEWESAARGPDAKMFPWGGDKPNCNYLNFNGCLDPAEPYAIRAYSFGASDFNVFDMAGNVAEWVGDWYAKDYYLSSPSVNPTGPLEGTKRVYRGGSYKSSGDEINSYFRFALEPEKQSPEIGFRCVIEQDPLSETAPKIGQPCQVAGMNDNLNSQATATPFPCSAAEVTGFCQRINGIAFYGVDIRQSGCLGNQLHSMTSNSQPLTCKISELPDGGKRYLCTFPGMAQGININLSYCHSFTIPQVAVTCPTGYQLNQNTKWCDFEKSKLPSSPCTQGYLNVPSAGCLPLDNPDTGGCPIGFYSFEFDSVSVCMPLNKCLLSDGPDSCENTICLAGQKFDARKNCCDSADLPKRVCAADLIYNADQNVCLGSDLYSKNCINIKTKIPYCPTLTPTPTPTPIPIFISCSDYKDYTACKSIGCSWSPGLQICY